MQLIYVVSRMAVTPGYIPDLEQAIRKRRIIRRTPKGYRLAAVDAPQDAPGTRYMRTHYSFFATHAAACEEVARQANETAAHFEAEKLDAIRLMCAAQDGARAG